MFGVFFLKTSSIIPLFLSYLIFKDAIRRNANRSVYLFIRLFS